MRQTLPNKQPSLNSRYAGEPGLLCALRDMVVCNYLFVGHPGSVREKTRQQHNGQAPLSHVHFKSLHNSSLSPVDTPICMNVEMCQLRLFKCGASVSWPGSSLQRNLSKCCCLLPRAMLGILLPALFNSNKHCDQKSDSTYLLSTLVKSPTNMCTYHSGYHYQTG